MEVNRDISLKIVPPLEKYAKHKWNEITSRQSADQCHAHRKLNRWHRFQTRRKQKRRIQSQKNCSTKSKKSRPYKPKQKRLLSLEFTHGTDRSKTTLECQLDTGATCNVLSHRGLSITSQDGNLALQTSKVKLRLFNRYTFKRASKSGFLLQIQLYRSTHA